MSKEPSLETCGLRGRGTETKNCENISQPQYSPKSMTPNKAGRDASFSSKDAGDFMAAHVPLGHSSKYNQVQVLCDFSSKGFALGTHTLSLHPLQN